MNIELTDDEVTTIMVALDNYSETKRVEWMESRADPDAPDMGDEELLDESGSAEWCWQKLFAAQQEFRGRRHDRFDPHCAVVRRALLLH
jgi:hypothetical protein